MFQDAAEEKAGMSFIPMVTIPMVPFQYSKEEVITLHSTQSRYTYMHHCYKNPTYSSPAHLPTLF